MDGNNHYELGATGQDTGFCAYHRDSWPYCFFWLGRLLPPLHWLQAHGKSLAKDHNTKEAPLPRAAARVWAGLMRF